MRCGSLLITVACLCFLISLLDAVGQSPHSTPRSPDESRRSFRLEPGVEAQCVASEPAIASPSAMAFDSEGRLFVAENRGYPVGPGPGKSPVGAIIELRDLDGDGRYETRVEFAIGLTFPNGLMPWRGGWLVSCSPDLLYLKDTNGDGRADVREVWFTGFATNQTTQLRACYPTLGIDGWIYLSRGWSGGNVISPKWPELKSIDLARGDFRFRPDGSAAEAIGGNGQFGLAFDEFGHRFIVSNRNPLMQAVVHRNEWERNPHLPFTDITQDVSPSGYDAKVFPLSSDLTTSGFMPDLLSKPHAGSYTSACGIHWYRGGRLGQDRQRSWFICEPAQNLVQRQIMLPMGASFRSRSASTNSDFLDSSDSWFHPVYATTAPDGSLWIADMYRKFIDHPDYLPEQPRKKLDFNSGKDLGRLWRFARVGEKLDAASALKSLRTDDPTQWVDLLHHPNGWVSETARRLIVEEQLRQQESGGLNAEWSSVVQKGLIRFWGARFQGPEITPAARAAAVGLLKSLGMNPGKIGALAFGDQSPGVREVAVRLLTRSPDDLRHPAKLWLSSLRKLAHDSDTGVRFQVALAMGDHPELDLVEELATLALRDSEDRWTRSAVLSSVRGRETNLAHALISSAASAKSDVRALFRETAQMIGSAPLLSQSDWLLTRLLKGSGGDADTWRNAALLGLAQGLRSRGWGDEQGTPLLALAANASDKTLAESLSVVARAVALQAKSSTLSASSRAEAIWLLSEFGFAGARSVLEESLSPSESTAVQLASVRSLGRFNDHAAAEILAAPKHWSTYAPGLREAALSALMGSSRGVLVLLTALERETIPVSAIDLPRRNQLINNRDTSVREKARKLFDAWVATDRYRVFEDFKPVLQLSATPQNGHEVFKRLCVQCHTHSGEGSRVGPDLTGVQNQPAEALLFHILVPEAEIYPGYQSYALETKDGRSLTGLLVAETEASVTLRQSLGVEETVSRSNVASLQASPLSLMPQGFEQTMSKQELADLVAFLKRGAVLRTGE